MQAEMDAGISKVNMDRISKLDKLRENMVVCDVCCSARFIVVILNHQINLYCEECGEVKVLAAR